MIVELIITFHLFMENFYWVFSFVTINYIVCLCFFISLNVVVGKCCGKLASSRAKMSNYIGINLPITIKLKNIPFSVRFIAYYASIISNHDDGESKIQSFYFSLIDLQPKQRKQKSRFIDFSSGFFGTCNSRCWFPHFGGTN